MSKTMMVETTENKKYVASLLKDTTKCPKGGLAEIRIKNPKRTGSLGIRGYTDPATREFREFFDKNGHPRTVRYTKKRTLDMNNDDDRLEFYHVSNHPVFTKCANPVLTVVYLEKEAEDLVKKRDRQADVTAIVRDLSGEKLRNFSRVLLAAAGMRYNPKTSENALKKAIYELSDKEPDSVLAAWQDEERPLKELVRKAVEKEVFTVVNSVWKFGDEIIGRDFNQACAWMKSREELMPKLKQELM